MRLFEMLTGLSESLNRTMMELKFVTLGSVQIDFLTLNRTMMELKLGQENPPDNPFVALNRTMMELK